MTSELTNEKWLEILSGGFEKAAIQLVELKERVVQLEQQSYMLMLGLTKIIEMAADHDWFDRAEYEAKVAELLERERLQ